MKRVGRTWEPGSVWRPGEPVVQGRSLPIRLGPSSGYTPNGLPYNPVGRWGPRPVLLEGTIRRDRRWYPELPAHSL